MSSRATGWTALGLILILLGAGWLLEATGVIDLDPANALAVLLIAVGLAIVLVPRGHGPLLALAVPLFFAGVGALAIDVDRLDGGVGELHERPLTTGELERTYELGVGKLELDLRELELPAGTTGVEATVGIGDLVVHLPPGVALEAHGEGGIGEVSILDEHAAGFGPQLDVDRAGGDAVLDLRVEVGIGHAQVSG
jgi:hypothetical protein